MPDPVIQQQMREDWDRRAREDAHYYVAFGRRRQTTEEFFATAAEVVHAVEVELERFPPSTSPRDLTALEIGCGPGRLMVPLSHLVGRIVGVDISPEMVEMARRNLEGIPRATVQVGSDLSAFPDETFDLCYSYAVFQHIPSREVVLEYLREAWRVLKVGGILKCQVDGLPEQERRQADTWSGTRFRPDEIRSFCREQDYQLLMLVGQYTQDMWMAARKQPRGWRASLTPGPGSVIFKVTNTHSSEPLVPAGGRFACAALWVENLAPDADINNLEVEIAGRRASPCYVGSDARQPRVQINVLLPEDTPTGLVPVRLWMLGEPISGFARVRVIPPPPRAPRLLSVTDGVNLLSNARIETRSVKVMLEELGPSPSLSAEIDGRPAEELHLFCADPLSECYVLNMKVSPEIPAGPHHLTVRLGGRAFDPVGIEIAE